MDYDKNYQTFRSNFLFEAGSGQKCFRFLKNCPATTIGYWGMLIGWTNFRLFFLNWKTFLFSVGKTPWKCYLKPHLSQARCLANAARLERLALTCEKASIVPFNAHRLWKLYVWPWPWDSRLVRNVALQLMLCASLGPYHIGDSIKTILPLYTSGRNQTKNQWPFFALLQF